MFTIRCELKAGASIEEEFDARAKAIQALERAGIAYSISEPNTKDETPWIRKADKPPREEDGDAAGCVFCLHDFNGGIVQSVRATNENSLIRYWMKIPAKPEKGTQDGND